jgi:hypothetical protein
MTAFFESQEILQRLVGAWWFFGLFVVFSVFNSILGEEFLFRGVLLPRMEGVFGGWSWVASGVLHAFWHVHQPWVILETVIGSYSSTHFRAGFRSTWIDCLWFPVGCIGSGPAFPVSQDIVTLGRKHYLANYAFQCLFPSARSMADHDPYAASRHDLPHNGLIHCRYSYYAIRSVICEAEPCPPFRLVFRSEEDLAKIGMTVASFAKMSVGLDILLAAVFTACALVIFIRKPRDPFTVFVTVMLVTFGMATFAGGIRVIAYTYPKLNLLVRTIEIFGNVAMLAFYFVFPNGRFTPRWCRPARLSLGSAIERAI